MPNLSQKDYSQHMELSYQNGVARGKVLGVLEAEQKLQHQRRQEIVSILKEAAALAQANAKLTYSLHMLVEKATKV